MSRAVLLRLRTLGWVLVGAGSVGFLLAVDRPASGLPLATCAAVVLLGVALASLHYILRDEP